MNGIETYTFDQPGYQPLVRSAGWMVALLNYEEGMSLDHLSVIERHVKSDEIFILLQGRAFMYFAQGDLPIEGVELFTGEVTNVRAGTWHNLIATTDVKLAIVENVGTDLDDTEIRTLRDQEIAMIHQQLTAWLK